MIISDGAGGSPRRARPRSRNIASGAAAGADAGRVGFYYDPGPAEGGYSLPTSHSSTTSSGQYTGSSGGGGNNGGGGRPSAPAPERQGPVQSVGRAPKPKPAPPPPPSLAKYLAGDSTYNDQISQLIKQFQDYATSNKGQRGDVNEDFRSTLDKMNQKKLEDLDALQNDFAARGLLTSGLYTDAVGDYDQDYQTQLGDLQTSKQRSLNDLLESMRNYKTENIGSRRDARQDAIRRRAQQYGIKG